MEYTVCMPMPCVRKRKSRRRKNSRLQQTARFRLTRLSAWPMIETCITFGVRVMFLIVILFIAAYICLLAGICIAFANSKCSCDTDEYGNDRPNRQR